MGSGSAGPVLGLWPGRALSASRVPPVGLCEGCAVRVRAVSAPHARAIRWTNRIHTWSRVWLYSSLVM